MASSRPFLRRAHLIRLALLALPLVAPGCVDLGPDADEETAADPPPPAAARPLALVECRAEVATGTLECLGHPPPRAGLVALDLRIVGGQGLFVGLSSSNVTYDDGVFSFDASVRNQSSLPMATADGSNRDAQGVRLFFVQSPTVTSGSGSVVVGNASGVGTFTAAAQPYFQYGGSLEGADQPELGPVGILASGEASAAKRWELLVPATTGTFTFSVLVATEMPEGMLASVAPQVTSIQPASLTPGAVAILTGTNFDPDAAGNTVAIGGSEATVVAASAEELQVTVPCVGSGTVAVRVTRGGMTGVALGHPLQVTEHDVPVGGVLILNGESGTACNELASAEGSARYVVSVFNTGTTPSSSSPFRFSADPSLGIGGGAGAPVSLATSLTSPAFSLADEIAEASRRRADREHLRIHEHNRRILEEFGHRLGPGSGEAAAQSPGAEAGRDTSPNRSFRIPNLNSANFCSSYFVVDATRVYLDGRIAIYEDDAIADGFKAVNSAVMASNYQRMGDQFNEDMDPLVRDYFGDVLRRDAVLDNNGVLLVLVSPRLNTSFPGVAGFVTSCDQFPNDDANTPPVGGPYAGSTGSFFAASNHGEIFYAMAPTVDAPGFGGNTPENWYRTMRSTFIHETKHVASFVARIANGAPVLEALWLEEGSARIAEEIWARNAVDELPWRGNTGYGDAADPVGVYCDVRPVGFAGCDANPRRPASVMFRHFSALHTHLTGANAALLSPFGPTPADDSAYFYAIAWSLLRYAADRYAGDEAAFFHALNQSGTQGVSNLMAVSGAGLEELLAGWTLALALDDDPQWASTPPTATQIPTWDFRSVYAGLNADFPGSFTLPYPLVPEPLGFGPAPPFSVSTFRGGGAVWFGFSGTQSAPQLLRLEGAEGGPPPLSLRLAVTRVQ